MRYEGVLPARFLTRHNRFVASCELSDGREVTVHVKNTGRCGELFVAGARVYLQHHNDPKRKTAYSLIAVQKGDTLFQMDSQAPNGVLREWLDGGGKLPGLAGKLSLIKPETTFGSSRFDFYLETDRSERAFVEAKGVTLEVEGGAYFPDAPTERGLRHIEELILARQAGYEAYVVFVLAFAGAAFFTPNMRTQPAFGHALCRARQAGVRVLAYACDVTPNTITLGKTVPVIIKGETT